MAAQVTREFVRSFAPDVAVSDILTPAPALAAELEGVPVATLVPHVHPDLPPGLPAVLDRRAAAAHAARRGALAADLPAGRDRARAGPARVQRLPRAPRSRAAAVGAHGALALADDGRDAPAARVPARLAVVAAGRRAADVGAGRQPVEPPAGARPGRARRALDLPGPRAPLLRRRAGRPRRRAGARDRDLGRAARGARQRGARALDVLRADDAALRPRDHPRRPRHARARAGQRLPGRRLPGGRRHGRERRARRLGRASASASRRASARRGACASRSAGRWRSRALRARAAESPRWAAAHPGPAAAAAQLERWAAGELRSRGGGGGGGGGGVRREPPAAPVSAASMNLWSV